MTQPARSATAKGSLWMLGAVGCFTSMAIAGRQVATTLDTFETMLYRSLIGIIVVVGVLGATGGLNSVSTHRLGLHFMRNLAHFTGQNLWFFAVGAIPMAQLFALEFTAPLWAILLAPLVLSEPISRQGLLAALLGFIGILIVAQPGHTALSPGIIAASLCGIGFALSALLTRKLTRDVSLGTILFWLTVMQAVFGLICAGYDGDIALPSTATTPWLIIIGLAGLGAHFCLTSALKLAPAATVMPIDFIRLPLIAVIGTLAFGDPADPRVFIGAAVIVLGNIINLRRRA